MLSLSLLTTSYSDSSLALSETFTNLTTFCKKCQIKLKSTSTDSASLTAKKQLPRSNFTSFGITLDSRYQISIPAPSKSNESANSHLWRNPDSQHLKSPLLVDPRVYRHRLSWADWEKSHSYCLSPASLVANNELYDDFSIPITVQNHIQRQTKTSSWKFNSPSDLQIFLTNEFLDKYNLPLHHPTPYLAYDGLWFIKQP